MQLDSWRGLQCDCCETEATHVRVSAEDAKTHDDVVILESLCDECFEERIWLHKADHKAAGRADEPF
jgi:hypothetical protein